CRIADASSGPRAPRRSSCPSCRTRRDLRGPSGSYVRIPSSAPPPSCGTLTLVLLGGDGQTELPLPHHGVDAGDIRAHRAQPAVVVELPGGHLEPEVEQLLLRLLQAQHELLSSELTKF